MACLPANSETTKKLVAERLALGDGRETTVLDLLGVELKGVFRELETLLNERSELADAAALLAQNFLGVGGADDDLREPDEHFVLVQSPLYTPQCARG